MGPRGKTVSLFLCGDVMLGRGVDQILRHPGAPSLREAVWGGSALDYVRLAERKNGSIPRAVEPSYVWGDALAELSRRKPDVRIINLETAVTTSEDWAPKGINYRMHPANAAVLQAAGVDCCVLANNHVLDFGASGLAETLSTLSAIGIRCAGAGPDAEGARAPAVLELSGRRRVLVFALADDESGVPPEWGAGASAGVWRLRSYGREQALEIGTQISRSKRAGDVVVVSLHWGGNWGYGVPAEQTVLAHALIDEAGADLVYGHSSHHPKAVELHRGKLILYGCGDFVDDYEGISGYEDYRDDLGFMYLARLAAASGRLERLELVPTRVRRFQVCRASREEALWLGKRMARSCAPFGTAFKRRCGGSLVLEPADKP